MEIVGKREREIRGEQDREKDRKGQRAMERES